MVDLIPVDVVRWGSAREGAPSPREGNKSHLSLSELRQTFFRPVWRTQAA